MPAGSTTLVAAQTKAQYRAQNANLIGQAFDALLDVTKSNSNILAQLQGGMGSGKPFVIKEDLTKGRMDTVNFNVGAPLGTAGRRGTQVLVNFEETPIQNSWKVQIDTLRVAVGYNEITREVATTGKAWQEVFAEMVGLRTGQIEQEDMLIRMRTRATSRNTLRPNNRTSIDQLHYDDTFDAATLNRAITSLDTNGAKPAKIATMESGMPLNEYVCLGSAVALEPLWNDYTFTQALTFSEVRGEGNPWWTGKLPSWRGTTLKRWNIVNSDTPGAIGSTILPQSVLGNPITGTPTAALTIYGGGRTQASLGNANILYAPFELFYGCPKALGETITVFDTITPADTGTYYFVIIDPADGKWNLYSYSETSPNAAFPLTNSGNACPAGNNIVTTNNLAASASGTALTTLGNYTFNATVNKEAFPTGSLIIQVNANVTPVCEVFVFGADTGAKAYGMSKDKVITQKTDYDAQVGKGLQTTYGCDMRPDTLGVYRGWIRVQAAYYLQGYTLPQL